MTDDLKQKADEAWENVARNDIRSAVEASIAAALAEALALERVARLEYRSTATATGVLPNGERVQCTECSGTTNSPSQFAWTCLDGRWRCETHSKPETGAISPPATQGILERMERLRVVRVLETRYALASVEITMPSPQGMWPHARGTEYVRADLLEAAEAETEAYRIREELHVAELEQTDKLASAERRIAELEKADEVLDEAKAQTMGLMLDKARAEGREAGIREAAEVARAMRDADTGPSEYAQGARQGLQLAGRRILALLAKKPEVGT